MASRNTHITIGVLAGLFIYGLQKNLKNEKWDFFELCTALCLGGVVGVLPDLLEPATSSYHRKFCHSITLLLSLTLKEEAYDLLNISESERNLCNVALGSYASHLLVDSVSPRSLPII